MLKAFNAYTKPSSDRLARTLEIEYVPTLYALQDWEFVCRHPETEFEYIETPYYYGEVDMTYETAVEVCTNCREEV